MSIENIYSRLVRKKIRVTRRELLDNAIFVFKNDEDEDDDIVSDESDCLDKRETEVDCESFSRCCFRTEVMSRLR